MKLHEYQSKRIFARYGVPIPKGEVATRATEAREIAQLLGGPVVVKSQVLVFIQQKIMTILWMDLIPLPMI